jgi:N-acetyl sugar amidotransferase
MNTPAPRSICSASVMDDSDPDIRFDENGVCQYVHRARERINNEVFRGAEGDRRAQAMADKIREEGKDKPYDCVVGVSGGVDSSYALLRVRELGLRPLAVHVDNGWNTELAVSNVERMLRTLDVDLDTYVIDWQEVRDLQRSFFLASVANVEIITDHSIFATLFHKCAQYGIRYIISGSNVETESIMPDSWGYDARDAHHIVGIHRKFGQLKGLKSYPLLFPAQFMKYIFMDRITMVPILNYGDYNKAAVLDRLNRDLGYVKYERKHGESRFTKFFQEYYLPTKFGFDKRKAHFSSLIVSGQMTREEALADLNKPLYRQRDLDIDIEFVTKKLGFTDKDWQNIMAAAPRPFSDYPNRAWMFDHKNPAVLLIREIARGDLSLTRIIKEMRQNRK